jgi:hypothetical protein
MAVKRDFMKGKKMNRRVSVTSMMLKAISSVVVTRQVGSDTHHHAPPIWIHHPKEVCKGE